MFKLEDYKANEIWVAVRISGSFMYINDMPYYVYILMDAVSAQVFGHVLAEAFGGIPDQEEITELFQTAYQESGNSWPRALIVADTSPTSNQFRKEAYKNSIPIDTIPLSHLSPIIGPLVKEFSDTYKKET